MHGVDVIEIDTSYNFRRNVGNKFGKYVFDRFDQVGRIHSGFFAHICR